MTYERVYSYDPPIIIVEDDSDDRFHLYVIGESVGLAYTMEEAEEMAAEIFDELTGADT